MEDRLKKLSTYLKNNGAFKEADEILKISIDYSDTDAANCEDFEFNDEGYRWKYICVPFGFKFQLLKNLAKNIDLSSKNIFFEEGSPAYNNLVGRKHEWMGQVISPPASGGNVRSHSPDQYEAWQREQGPGSPWPDPGSLRERVAPIAEVVERAPEALSDRQVYESLSEPGGVAPWNPKERNPVSRPNVNWVDNIAGNFGEYIVRSERGSFEDWINLKKPNTVPYTITMKPKGYSQRSNEGSFLIARNDEGEREKYRMLGAGQFAGEVMTFQDLESLRRHINAHKPRRTKPTREQAGRERQWNRELRRNERRRRGFGW